MCNIGNVSFWAETVDYTLNRSYIVISVSEIAQECKMGMLFHRVGLQKLIHLSYFILDAYTIVDSELS